jgi:predicted alpha/beta-hydrolase family hydrolase
VATGSKTGPETVREVGTPLGPARVHVRAPTGGLRRASGTLLLGHGAGGGVGAPDLQAAAAAAVAQGWVVGLVEQPWRVAGKRVAAPPPRLDEGWTAVTQALRRGRAALPEPFLFGGRSAGARVACRLAGPLEARGVVALAFPLHPPGRPDRSRLGELLGAVSAGVPVLVVQGERDPFGSPDELAAGLTSGLPRSARTGMWLVPAAGDHSLRSAATVRDAVGAFLRER